MDIANLKIHSYNTIIVGSGAAAFNAANSLFELGVKNIAIVTEGMKKGTSRNTGSDKQTYYKMSTSGVDGDSPYKMAETLYNGGAMHGDIALVEAALSTMNYYNLKRIGVPFPTDRYGQHIGYKTDHDPYTRASSAGPLTSKYMTECLERQIMLKDIDIFDYNQVISVIKDGDTAAGLLAIDLRSINGEDYGFTLFNCTNIIYCTGGPSCIYHSSVFPKSQFGGTGVALEAGVAGVNLTEWQYGMASTKFRWNVSGTYQQVLPRYVSTDENMGDERDFLCDHFGNYGAMNDAVFLKGYQWPFDARKLDNFASSTIDILVYIETQVKGRRVFLDYTNNPTFPGVPEASLFSALNDESRGYLERSDAMFGKPIDRLAKMNPLAIDLYRNNGIDITREYLEIDVCAQHNNGGLQGDIWWQSNVQGFFPVGEVNGTMGVYRPGGSALNSTQTGGARAALYISKKRKHPPRSLLEFRKLATPVVHAKLGQAQSVIKGAHPNIAEIRIHCQKAMTKAAAFFRTADEIEGIMPEMLGKLQAAFSGASIGQVAEIGEVFRNYDMLVCQYTYLCAMLEYIRKGGQSRGSYVIIAAEGEYAFNSEYLKFKYSIDKELHNVACVSKFDVDASNVSHRWEAVRPIPQDDGWFENVWREYRDDKIYH
ncbi:MAG: FAD-binding protein [Defluviitaleaceae bacterium]|nr:FAD-binding protein [Defluviitaleaceae bacterium]